MSVAREQKMKEWRCNIFSKGDSDEIKMFGRKRKSDHMY